ncbi:hypothetical protein Hypma_010684 [Hypsizygus marmoreus]|uniref:Uncharacterized protein n=1 Tax=Hypsizygus marmoreus TaxID=39966 RepID=A0A369JPJ0_HYPMA|nr:hypothetical protein Hypma_010684 [Hypsizygus marmoreus]
MIVRSRWDRSPRTPTVVFIGNGKPDGKPDGSHECKGLWSAAYQPCLLLALSERFIWSICFPLSKQLLHALLLRPDGSYTDGHLLTHCQLMATTTSHISQPFWILHFSNRRQGPAQVASAKYEHSDRPMKQRCYSHTSTRTSPMSCIAQATTPNRNDWISFAITALTVIHIRPDQQSHEFSIAHHAPPPPQHLD